MNILITDHGRIPAHLYGGTERVIWYLGHELVKMGHKVTYLVKEGSSCPFAQVLVLNSSLPIEAQIPEGTDLVHFQYQPDIEPNFPYLHTNHGNRNDFSPFLLNTVFVSANHASRYGSEAFVHNGLDWNDYGKPDLKGAKSHFHFLGNAAWRVKNVKGAIAAVSALKNEKLAVLGGNRFNFKMGLRFTWNPRIQFYGMVGGERKLQLIQRSKGLVFPVLWHEPFGLAIIESLYLGCPVFATPYGSLPELVGTEFGHLSANKDELSSAMRNVGDFNPVKCYEYAQDTFNSKKMAETYLNLYTRVLQGETINAQVPKLLEESPRFLPWS